MSQGLNVLYSGFSELREIPVRQVPGEPRRRWFMSANCDLIVWIRSDESLEGFQFCYDKDEREHSWTWTHGRGVDYRLVDSDEQPCFASSLEPPDPFDPDRVASIFEAESRAVPFEYVALVRRQLALLASGS